VPVKTVLGWLGKCSPEVRLPLAPLTPQNEARLREIAARYGLTED
jgi:4-hydroxy-tetrahydrodipicolinate synthase